MHISAIQYLSVKCPAGTFHNSSARICQPCPFGQYQNATASFKCAPCPELTFTKRMHVKSLNDCIRKTSVKYIGFDVAIYSFLCSSVPTGILFAAQIALSRIAPGHGTVFRVRHWVLSIKLRANRMPAMSVEYDDRGTRQGERRRLPADAR